MHHACSLTGAGEEVPAAEQVAGCRSQQILRAAQTTKTKGPGREEKEFIKCIYMNEEQL